MTHSGHGRALGREGSAIHDITARQLQGRLLSSAMSCATSRTINPDPSTRGINLSRLEITGVLINAQCLIVGMQLCISTKKKASANIAFGNA